jgi:LmbE family N-acetylglucosaminyl deacetylase
MDLPPRWRRALRWRAVSRLVLVGLALPCIYFGGAGAGFLLRQRAANAARDPLRLDSEPAPTAATRLMVFAPHSDDEALGCAGLIQQTRTAGGAVRAVLLTNGDGFRMATERYIRDTRPRPDDYVQFATHRQQESVTALASLGVPPEDVLFLGYPDRGLLPLWAGNWLPDSPYTSVYTRRSRSPYPRTFHPASRYCGQDVVQDIQRALRAFRPTLITVTHPADDHPDHAAAAAFVTLALLELQADPAEAHWAKSTHLRYYLIHRGDWPAPQGARPTAALLPPTGMTYLDTRWSFLPLTPEQTDQKARSIERYATQTAVMPRFLSSFVRKTELYGDLRPAPLVVVPEQSLRVDGLPNDWQALTPALLDPVRDSMLRDLQGSGDIRALTLCRDRQTLYVRLDTRLPINRRLTYTLRLRAFGPGGETSRAEYVLQLRPDTEGTDSRDGSRAVAKQRTLEAAIPLRCLLGPRAVESLRLLAVRAETALSGVEIDKTGIRFLTPVENGRSGDEWAEGQPPS